MKKCMVKPIFHFNQRLISSMEKEYLPFLKKWRNQQMQVLRQTKLLTDADQEKWFKRIYLDKKQFIFSLIQMGNDDNNDLIGYCGLTNIDYENHRAEASFLVNPERAKCNEVYREDFLSALWMVCWYGFEELNLHKIYTETYMNRTFHIRILEEFGLNPGGVLREHKLIGGKYWDSAMHSLLKREWEDVKERVKSELE